MGKPDNKDADLQEIVLTLTNFEDGRSIDGIETDMEFRMNRRTLQRRLNELIGNGIVTASGKARATRYKLLKNADYISANNIAEQEELLPMSKQSLEVSNLISLPPQKRDPAGHNRSFLDDYQPNISGYLTRQEKEKLANLGSTLQLNGAEATYKRQVLQRFQIDFAWNSSRLEGNTYSLPETKRLLNQGLYAHNKSAAEAQMIFNHKDAIEFILNNSSDIGFNRYTILSLHAILSNNLLSNPAASGSLRINKIDITGSVYTPPGNPQLVEEKFMLMLQKTDQIQDPFEQAFFIMVQMPYLQPFDDVNRQVSRMAANISLNKKGFAPLSFVEVPDTIYNDGLLGVYELNRIELLKDVFLWAYERSAKQYAIHRQSIGEPDPLRMKYRETLKALIAEIITESSPREEASKKIEAWARHLPRADQDRFIQTVETELISLHEGNFARYFVSPAQFKNWQEVWDMN